MYLKEYIQLWLFRKLAFHSLFKYLFWCSATLFPDNEAAGLRLSERSVEKNLPQFVSCLRLHFLVYVLQTNVGYIRLSID